MSQELGNRIGRVSTSNIKDLAIVPGHACFRAEINGDLLKDPTLDELWLLSNFQRGEPKFFVDHIKTGMEVVKNNKNSLLVFSGSWTRDGCGDWSEAGTYFKIAKDQCQQCQPNQQETINSCDVLDRTALEENALDSFQNVLYSLDTFHKMTGNYPRNVYVINWKFKEERFYYHLETLGFPKTNIVYVGVGNPDDLEGAMKGESKTIELFKKYPFGDSGELLDKRMARDIKKLYNPDYERVNLDELLSRQETGFSKGKVAA